MRFLKRLLKSKGYIQIPLILTHTNHFEITVKINGVRGRFILDTGASSTCVNIDKMACFKMVSKASGMKAAGAGAMGMDTLVSAGNTVEIGAWRKRRQYLVSLDLVHVNQALIAQNALPVDGIIGIDILTQGKATIDCAGKYLYLKNR